MVSGKDDERLKRGTYLTEKYFDEQLERIREIRASERKFYQKITDLYATAIDNLIGIICLCVTFYSLGYSRGSRDSKTQK